MAKKGTAPQRAEWGSTPHSDLTVAELDKLLKPFFPQDKVIGRETARGGLSNANIKVQLEKRQRPVLIRLYYRDSGSARSIETAEKEYNLNALTRERVCVPRFYGFAPSNPVSNHPYAVMDFVQGERLELVVNNLSDEQLLTVGTAVGASLADIHSFSFEQTGFFDGQLNISQPVDMDRLDIKAFISEWLDPVLVRSRLGDALTDDLIQFVDEHGHLAGRWEGKPCLIHSDFGGSNILINDGAVSSVLDWEFAFSGRPSIDFGNLLRPGLGSRDAFVRGVEQGYEQNGGTLPDQWRRLSRLSDLFSWTEFMNRPNCSDALIRDARQVISDTISDNY